MAFFVIISAYAQEKKDLSNNSSKSTQTLGGVTNEGNLLINIYDNANMQVFRYISGQWVHQWYGTSSKSIWFYADGQTYSGSGCYFNGASNIMTTVSNTNIDANTNELVMESSGQFRIKQITYYPPESAVIYYKWEITNLSGTSKNDFRLFSGGDTYLQGGDNGAGFWLPLDNTVGVKKTISNNLQKLNMQGVTIPYAYESRGYWDVYQSVVSNHLTNVLDENEYTDNGMALEYRKAVLNTGETWVVEAIEKFSSSPITNIIVTAPLSSQIAPGNTVDLTFTIRNRTAQPTSVTLEPSVDLANWTTELISPPSPYLLAGNAIQDVVIRVFCPAGTPLGTTSKVTLSATDLSGTASDYCNVTAAEVPSITSHPENQTKCEGDTAFFSITALNAENYQWQEFRTGWNNISDGGMYSGATTANLVISSVTSDMNNYQYRCLVSNEYGNAVSNSATLTVLGILNIVNHPQPSEICDGGNTGFNVNVSGSNVSYQWQENNKGGYQNIIEGGIYSGTTTGNLVITGANFNMNEYMYRCMVSNLCSGTVISNEAELTVNRAPYISSQPEHVIICEGENAAYTVEALGNGLTYQWQVNEGSGFYDIIDGGVYSGATTNTLHVTDAPVDMNGFEYQCIVSGTCNPSATTESALLTVNSYTVIATQPVSTVVCETDTTHFMVVASGSGITYQWQVNEGSGFVNITDGDLYSGSNTATLTISGAIIEMNGYLYRCELVGTCNNAATDEATLTVNDLPAIIEHPVSASVCVNDNSGFLVAATGTDITYQWQVNEGAGFYDIVDGGVYSGATTTTLMITGAVIEMNGYEYRCVVSGTCNPAAISEAAILTVLISPVVNTQPLASETCETINTSFVVEAAGHGLIYQWQVDANDGNGFVDIYDGENYFGTNTNQLDVLSPGFIMNGYLYRCYINGTCNPAVFSDEALLTVLDAPNVFLGNDTLLCDYQSITLDAGPGENYVWSIPELQGQIVTVDISMIGYGTTDISVIVTDSNNCEGNDVIAITYEICAGIDKLASSEVKIYPNPANGLVNITFPDNINSAEITVYDITGNVIRNEFVYNHNKAKLDMSNEVKGIYTVKIIMDNKVVYKKLIVQ